MLQVIQMVLVVQVVQVVHPGQYLLGKTKCSSATEAVNNLLPQ